MDKMNGEMQDIEKTKDKTEYKKSYKGFVAFIFALTAIMIFLPSLPIIHSAESSMLAIMNICTIGMAMLMYIIYKTEYVYWFNGTEYEEALKAGSERRKKFAWEHFKRFGLFALVYGAFSCGVCLLNLSSYWINLAVGTIGLICVAISTIRIKL